MQYLVEDENIKQRIYIVKTYLSYSKVLSEQQQKCRLLSPTPNPRTTES